MLDESFAKNSSLLETTLIQMGIEQPRRVSFYKRRKEEAVGRRPCAGGAQVGAEGVRRPRARVPGGLPRAPVGSSGWPATPCSRSGLPGRCPKVSSTDTGGWPGNSRLQSFMAEGRPVQGASLASSVATPPREGLDAGEEPEVQAHAFFNQRALAATRMAVTFGSAAGRARGLGHWTTTRALAGRRRRGRIF